MFDFHLVLNELLDIPFKKEIYDSSLGKKISVRLCPLQENIRDAQGRQEYLILTKEEGKKMM